MAISIRLATLSDLERLAALFDDYREFYGQASSLDAARAFLKERLEKHESVVFLAAIGEATVGFAQLYPLFSSVSMRRLWLLNDLFVAEGGRRQGCGRALLAAAVAHGKATHSKGLLLQTAIENEQAQRLYEATGWKRDRTTYYYEYTF